MRPDGWHLTEDLDDFISDTTAFLRSRPALHTMALTSIERLRVRGQTTPATLLGRLHQGGQVRATFHQPPGRGPALTPLTPDQADSLAAHLIATGHRPPSAGGDRSTAENFTDAWRRHTGTTPTVRVRLILHRLATLTPPQPKPPGRGRPATAADHDHLLQWCRDLAVDLHEDVTVDDTTWPGTRFAEKTYTFWQNPDGEDVAMAGVTPMIGGQIRVDPVYTPRRHRRHGYGAAVTTEVTRAALAAGATDVVLFTDAGNPTSNALYRRLGYVPLTDWAVYDLG
ncbi:GNAT family N-acetyltransferase [Actinoplanes couchii]|uniref:N-acetyltransferase n=1 Tax=Actinoplanes couchii TaxID=403638 RepID=A0ABQ3XLM0_9ACTN|nr:GNAT family N-acetyltransferase [Actinoplanes couchii]MDR6319380.1 RimJ/RimL family protein N-acetyltransferase [Actinoplanes couchii]GID59409.1 N-acetyltransferase [Actinoplanes couchii]